MSGNLLDRFNDTIDRWIKCLDDYTLDELRSTPIPGSWSLGQVYVHITEDTPYHVEQIRVALRSDDNQDKEMHGDGRAMLGSNEFPNMQIEGASTVDSVRQPLSKEELFELLTSIRKDVNDLAHQYDIGKSKGKSQHPGLWYFTAAEWLQFTEMHMRHHFRQKERIDKAITAGRNPR